MEMGGMESRVYRVQVRDQIGYSMFFLACCSDVITRHSCQYGDVKNGVEGVHCEFPVFNSMAKINRSVIFLTCYSDIVIIWAFMPI
jgi:hypothetical protein